MIKLPFLLFFLSSTVFSNIFEIDRIDEVKSYLEKDTLVLFDIDNTIMHPVQELGRDQWFYYRISEYEDQGLSFSEALEKALEEWISILHVTQVSAVEKQVISLIDQIQCEGFSLMGLTARGLGISTITMKQLRTLNINLTKTAPFDTEALVLNPRGVLFRAGILFTSGTNRGTSLFKFFDHVDIKPKKLLFINDKHKDLASVEKVCKERNIPFTGLRYGYLDQKVKSFRKDIAAVQFEHFGYLLSDEEAENMLKDLVEGAY